MQHLTNQEYLFFSKLIRAVLSNPFSDDRDILYGVVSKKYLSESEKNAKIHFFKKLQPLLNDHLAKLEQRQLTRLEHFEGMENRVMYFAFIITIYLQFVDDFDAYIEVQSQKTQNSLSFSKGAEILEQLKQRGFCPKESVRLLELLYQFRRGYLFILHGLVGQSPCMIKLRANLWNNLFTFDVLNYHQSLWNQMEDFSLFLVGETGTGKGSAAKAIGLSGHIHYDQQSQSFRDHYQDIYVESNLSQYAENLIESELFGHKKGAFTGAFDNYQGLFSRCKLNGLLFLDEIGDISESIQIKLLKVLQERTFTPVGCRQAEEFHGRIIAAANQPLAQLRYDGKIRDDFYYRLCSDIIEIPPLRRRLQEHPKELQLLTKALVKRICHEPNQGIEQTVLDALSKHIKPNYTWPGNVRELEQAIRRIILRGSYHGDRIRLNTQDPTETLLAQLADTGHDLKSLNARYCQMLYQQLGTYDAVATHTQIDRRTVKKYVDQLNAES